MVHKDTLIFWNAVLDHGRRSIGEPVGELVAELESDLARARLGARREHGTHRDRERNRDRNVGQEVLADPRQSVLGLGRERVARRPGVDEADVSVPTAAR